MPNIDAYVYCVDCGAVTPQMHKGTTKNGEEMFICNWCGCENYEPKELPMEEQANALSVVC